jgi:hypothetical protein
VAKRIAGSLGSVVQEVDEPAMHVGQGDTPGKVKTDRFSLLSDAAIEAARTAINADRRLVDPVLLTRPDHPRGLKKAAESAILQSKIQHQQQQFARGRAGGGGGGGAVESGTDDSTNTITWDPEDCFDEGKPFAHMHLGMFGADGKIHTNIWIPSHSTHVKDALPLDVMLPVSRCRAGPIDVPCPRNVTGFLTLRNKGEYRKKSSDGSCLLVRKKWKAAQKAAAADRVRRLDQCGYNSMVDLLPSFIASGHKSC